jgi:hypothetical protein
MFSNLDTLIDLPKAMPSRQLKKDIQGGSIFMISALSFLSYWLYQDIVYISW